MSLIDNTYISASSTRNFFLDDPLLDWLDKYGVIKGYKKNNSPYSFSKYIMDLGKKFEAHIFSLIKQKFPKDFVYIPTFHGKDYSQKTTLEHLQKGTPIIYQGFLVNHKNKTYGYPDLIVRSDYLNLLFGCDVISNEKANKGCLFSDNYHYRIIDIKYSTISILKSKLISNTGSSFAYKGQVCIYNEALGLLQRFIPRHSYILGRFYKYDDKTFLPFDNCGIVDFKLEKDIQDKLDKCLSWFKILGDDGMNWDIYPKPSVKELYPNMKNDNDSWFSVKKELANKVNEITLVWNCGVSDRNYLHTLGITSFIDDRCNSDTLTKSGKLINKTLDNILEANRGKELMKKNKKILSNGYFVDFETISNIYDITGKSPDRLVMIGVIGCDSDGVEKETVLTAEDLSDLSEKFIISQFLELISPNGEDNPIVYHYSSYEPVYFKKKMEMLGIQTSININWVDLLSIVKDENMFYKGCLNFSLKSYMNVFGFNKSENDILNGNEAMVALIKYYTENDKNVIDKIKEYNIIDCRMLKVLKYKLEE